MKKENEIRDEILRQEAGDVVCDCVHPKKKKQAKQDAEQKDERMNMKLIFPPAKEELQDIKALECLNDELEEGEINDDLMITDNAKG